MFWLRIAAEGIFCCHNNSSLELCGAEMSKKRMLALAFAFEVNREEKVSSQQCLWVHNDIRERKPYGAYNNLVQELRLDDARFAAYLD